jgi:hypothetical protein
MIEAKMKFLDFEWSTAEDFGKDFMNLEGRKTVATLGNWYEGLGVLVRENLLDIRVVSLFISGK